MKKEILAVRRGKLFADGRTFRNFISKEDAKTIGLDRNFILANAEYLPKSELENKPEYKQIIAYCVLLGDYGHVFSYQRGPREPRLKDKWSIGIGGHIYKMDDKWDMMKSNVIKRVNEEVDLGSRVMGLRHLGYINCEDSSVNKDHLAMLYLKDVYDVGNIKPQKETGKDLLHAEFRSQPEIEKIMEKHEFEEWSEIAYNVLLKEGKFKPKEFYKFP
ncbi:MAG: hypothetical protein AABX17_01075 [Nanoarchaeota archaeon]